LQLEEDCRFHGDFLLDANGELLFGLEMAFI
jgi:hypothetical protein